MKKNSLMCVECRKKYSGSLLDVPSHGSGLACAASAVSHPLIYECPYCNGILQVVPTEGWISEKERKFNKFSDFCNDNLTGMWRYKEFLPVEDENNIITLGEGMTALVRAENIYQDIGIENLYVKNEFSNPTASFKDRPTSVGISVAKEYGADTVAVARQEMREFPRRHMRQKQG